MGMRRNAKLQEKRNLMLQRREDKLKLEAKLRAKRLTSPSAK